MRDIRLKNYIKYLYFGALIFHSLNKFLLRPWVLKNDFPGFAKVFVLSVPNFLEAVVGIINISILLVLLKWRSFKFLKKIPDIRLYTVALFLSSTYVITQELKIHNLGGRNVYDPNDLIASVIGLTGVFTLIAAYGVLEYSLSQKTAS